MRPNPQETADLVTFTEEIISGKLLFCAVFDMIYFSERCSTPCLGIGITSARLSKSFKNSTIVSPLIPPPPPVYQKVLKIRSSSFIPTPYLSIRHLTVLIQKLETMCLLDRSHIEVLTVF